MNSLNDCIAFIIDRDNAKRLLYENDILQMQMSNSERDTLEVISFLKQEDSKKDEQVTNANSVMTLGLNDLQYGVVDNSYQLNYTCYWINHYPLGITRQVLAGAIEWVAIYSLDCIMLGCSIDFGGTHPMDSDSCLVDSAVEVETELHLNFLFKQLSYLCIMIYQISLLQQTLKEVKRDARKERQVLVSMLAKYCVPHDFVFNLSNTFLNNFHFLSLSALSLGG